MKSLYYLADLKLGEPTQKGHEVYLDAVYVPPDQKENPSNVIFKKNKYGKQKFSRMEVGFSHLAHLFLAKGTTAHQNLVINESQKVVGLVTEHINNVIGKNEGLNSTFYTFDNPNENCNVSACYVSRDQEIPYYFFDKLPQGFFAKLLDAEKSNRLTIDYVSLASILSSSYTLEEDDLHKGNFGFYLVEKKGKPQAVFFKIDHDLMYTASIMSFKAIRLSQWIHGNHAFDITAEDLLNFPILKNSTNFYWPTKFNYSSSSDNKKYNSFIEVEAFGQLSNVEAFKKSKWMAFYKHILIPQKFIELTLKKSFDEHNECERAEIALIAEATIARQARLKAVLFSLKEFREFIVALTTEEQSALIRETSESFPQVDISTELKQMMSSLKKKCRLPQGFVEGDTPLHTAIKLGNYRYEESIETFGQFINCRNKAGKTPLDCAAELLPNHSVLVKDIRADSCFIMQHLLQNGAEHSKQSYQFSQKNRIDSYKFKIPYLNQVGEAKNYQQLKDILRDIGEDHSYCLKFKKNVAIKCITQFISLNQKNPELGDILIRLRKDMNGENSKSDCAGLKYIRQLRSRLWIIRLLRGLYGTTSSLMEINRILDNALDQIKTRSLNSHSFFNGGKTTTSIDSNENDNSELIKPPL